MRPPEWRAYPAAAMIAALPDPLALEAARLSARLIADDLVELGITVDAAPVLDLPAPGADPVIGDRAWGTDPARVAALGRAVCDGSAGRRRAADHQAHPRTRPRAGRQPQGAAAGRRRAARCWRRTDFAPFRALAGMPWAMTAHIVYTAIDETAPATLSRIVIDSVIRGEIGFDGVLVSDDVSMGALAGSLAERTRRALDAGCDLVLHCNGDIDEMERDRRRRPAADAGRRRPASRAPRRCAGAARRISTRARPSGALPS